LNGEALVAQHPGKRKREGAHLLPLLSLLGIRADVGGGRSLEPSFTGSTSLIGKRAPLSSTTWSPRKLATL
jgi:hypothetical protein